MQGEFLVIDIVIRLICAGIASAIASSKGRSAVGWFCCAFVFHIIGIIIIACLSDLKAQKFKEMAIERENRRLREQVLQEQMKAEAFRQHAASRLDAHDVHLGLDTRALNPALGGPSSPLSIGFDNTASDGSTPPSLPAAPPAVGPAPLTMSRQWFYEVSGDSRGPITEDQLGAMLQAGQLNQQSLVWTEQLGEWRSAGEVVHLRRWLS